MPAEVLISRLGEASAPWKWILHMTGVPEVAFRALLADMRSTIPADRRTYRWGAKSWLFADEHADAVLVELLAQHGVTPVIVDLAPAQDAVMARLSAKIAALSEVQRCNRKRVFS